MIELCFSCIYWGSTRRDILTDLVQKQGISLYLLPNVFNLLSQEYMKNIQIVDDIVRQTETIFSEFFQDEETSFIFTADHGMSEIGNHGDGGTFATHRHFYISNM